MKKTLFKEISYWSGVLIVGLVVGLGIQFVRAWVEPTAEAPGGNLGAPITTTNVGQYKAGNLAVNTNGSWANGLLVPYGNVGIGTANPRYKLEVAGPIGFNAARNDSTWIAGVGVGSAASNLNSISVDTIETMKTASGGFDSSLEVFYYNPGAVMNVYGDVCTSAGKCLNSTSSGSTYVAGGIYGYCTSQSMSNGWCGSNGETAKAPAYCNQGWDCACPSGFTLVTLGMLRQLSTACGDSPCGDETRFAYGCMKN